jgi:hypothetical protein
MDDAGVLERVEQRLRPMRESDRFPPALLARFAEWVARAPDEDLFRVNPLQFAEREDVAPKDALDLFVHATRAGIFDFSWGVLCLDCGAFIHTRGGLRAMGKKRYCKL